jgi:hypothetical protein
VMVLVLVDVGLLALGFDGLEVGGLVVDGLWFWWFWWWCPRHPSSTVASRLTRASRYGPVPLRQGLRRSSSKCCSSAWPSVTLLHGHSLTWSSLAWSFRHKLLQHNSLVLLHKNILCTAAGFIGTRTNKPWCVHLRRNHSMGRVLLDAFGLGVWYLLCGCALFNFQSWQRLEQRISGLRA